MAELQELVARSVRAPQKPQRGRDHVQRRSRCRYGIGPRRWMLTQATHLLSVGTGPEQRAEESGPALTVLGVRTGSSVYRMMTNAASQVSAETRNQH